MYFDLVWQDGASSRKLYYLSGNAGSNIKSSDNTYCYHK